MAEQPDGGACPRRPDGRVPAGGARTAGSRWTWNRAGGSARSPRWSKRQFAGIDNAPHLKAQARQELLARAGAAYAAGGLEMFLSTQQVAGIPLAASLVIFLMPPSRAQPVTAEELAGSLDGEGRQVRVADLPAGTGGAGAAAHRARETRPPPPWRYSCRCRAAAGGCCCRSAAPVGPLAPA